jgi:hypothetical protein
MNIKKLIRETLGLDLFYNLGKDEKVALKFLHKKYSNEKYDFSLNVNEMIDLVEDMGFNFTTSMKLANLYKNHRDRLFKDFHEKYYDLDESKIVYNALQRYIGGNAKETEINSLVTNRFKSSMLSKKYDPIDFFIWNWNHSGLAGFYLTYSNSINNRWKCIVKYDFSNLLKMSGELKSIPFEVTIESIEGNFPMPELEGVSEMIEIPITFDIENMTKKDIYDIYLGENNSLFADFDKRIMEIMSSDKD